jgi:hypothetical protein
MTANLTFARSPNPQTTRLTSPRILVYTLGSLHREPEASHARFPITTHELYTVDTSSIEKPKSPLMRYFYVYAI